MPNVYEVAARHQAALLRRDTEVLARMVSEYTGIQSQLLTSLAGLTDRIQAARAREEPIGRSWLMRQERYQSLVQQTELMVNQFGRNTAQTITVEQRDLVTLAGQHVQAETAAALGRSQPAVRIMANFARLPAEAVNHLIGTTGAGTPLNNLLAPLGQQAVQGVEETLIRGVARGLGPREIARDLREHLNGNQSRALTIARTEALRSYRGAARQNFQENDDIIGTWVWHAHLRGGNPACACCVAMHGSVHPVTEILDGHPNCFPAGTLVTGPRALGSTSRWFEGELVEIVTHDGRLIAVTPNHPILTSRGWVASGLLHEGDDVISCLDAERVAASADPDSHQPPALIEDIAAALEGPLGMAATTVPTTTKDFHGDGMDAEVCVVGTNRLLRRDRQPAFFKPALQLSLQGTGMQLHGLTGLSSLTLALERICRSATGFIGGQGVGAPLFRCPSCDKLAINGGSISKSYSQISQHVDDGASTDVESVSELLGSLAGLVAADKIVGIRRYPFRGQVYNLETTKGWYVANGIVSHNCRCAMVPKPRSWAELGYPEMESTQPNLGLGKDWLRAQPNATRVQILGRQGARLYDEGADLELWVAQRDSPAWGTMRYQSSTRVVADRVARQRAGNLGELPGAPVYQMDPPLPSASRRKGRVVADEPVVIQEGTVDRRGESLPRRVRSVRVKTMS